VRRKDTGASHPLVIKRVRPPSGSGVSHQRKLKSYQARSGDLTAGAMVELCAMHWPGLCDGVRRCPNGGHTICYHVDILGSDLHSV